MYRFSSNDGFLLFPNQETPIYKRYKIKETDGVLKIIGLAIPQKSENFKKNIELMNENEGILKRKLREK